MLSRAAAIALRALVELAREPGATLSVAELARRQALPQPMLEQIVLRLRRAGLVEARRGRHGGYRLAERAETLPLARVLRAVEVRQAIGAAGAQAHPADPMAGTGGQSPAGVGQGGDDAAPPQAREPSGDPATTDAAHALGASAGYQVEQQLRRRLERLVQQELQRLTLAELLYDQRSWEASLGPEGGLMLS
jgi:Rrf2 family iron-sulfur cluster assembly transcriptional regulator